MFLNYIMKFYALIMSSITLPDLKRLITIETGNVVLFHMCFKFRYF